MLIGSGRVWKRFQAGVALEQAVIVTWIYSSTVLNVLKLRGWCVCVCVCVHVCMCVCASVFVSVLFVHLKKKNQTSILYI